MPVPQEAIEAALQVIDEQHCCGGHANQKDAETVARALLEAAGNISRMESQGTEILGALGREQARADTREAELAALKLRMDCGKDQAGPCGDGDGGSPACRSHVVMWSLRDRIEVDTLRASIAAAVTEIESPTDRSKAKGDIYGYGEMWGREKALRILRNHKVAP